MSQKSPQKLPQSNPVATAATPIDPAPETSPAPMVVVDREQVEVDQQGYLAIGLAAGALSVVAVLVVLIVIAAN